MICPYCNNKMNRGFIKNREQKLSWIPDGEKAPLTSWSISKNGIALGNYSFFSGGETVAFYCAECKKIILDV